MTYTEKIRLPELLAPAGSMDHIRAAFAAGADAVYAGGHRYGARAYADNLDSRQMADAVRYAHFYGRKLYLTVNTLMKESETGKALYDFLRPLNEAGLDGVIVQDPGAASFIRKHFPEIELHGSTQMTITDPAGARAAKAFGMTRVVPARELSLNEIRKIKETGLEVEVFIHGALCYSYSGQCLLSSARGGRSGNRGRCAQPCRLLYRTGQGKGGLHLFSMKDLCTLESLPGLVEAGVDSLKIEGRMRSIAYTAGVTAIYRRYLDRMKDDPDFFGNYVADPADIAALEDLYNRGSFTDGYYFRHNGKEMMSLHFPANTGHRVGTVSRDSDRTVQAVLTDRVDPGDLLLLIEEKPSAKGNRRETALTVPSSHKPELSKIRLRLPAGVSVKAGQPLWRRSRESQIRQIQEDYIKDRPSVEAALTVSLRRGRPLSVKAMGGGQEIFLEGDIPEESVNRPLTADQVRRQMTKTGATPFTVTDCRVDMEPGLYLPMSSVKKLRQDLFSCMEEKLNRSKDRPDSGDYIEDEAGPSPAGHCREDEGISSEINSPLKVACIIERKTFDRIMESSSYDEVCLMSGFFNEDELVSMLSRCREKGISCSLSLPAILREEPEYFDEKQLAGLCSLEGWSRIYVHTLGQAQLLKEMYPDTVIAAGTGLYQWNTQAVHALADLFPSMRSRVLPLELSREELLAQIRAEEKPVMERELFVSGYFPVMVSAQCVFKSTGKCRGDNPVMKLTGQDGERMTVTAHCKLCYNQVWSERPRHLGQEDLKEISPYISRYHYLPAGDILEEGRELSRRKTSGQEDAYWNCGVL